MKKKKKNKNEKVEGLSWGVIIGLGKWGPSAQFCKD